MLILAIDTATNIGSVALFDSEKRVVIGEITLNVRKNHSAIINKVLDSLLILSGVKKEEIDKIAVSIGPGSFTGIRIGVALAKGLAYALKKPIVGINELDMLANIYSGNKDVVVILDARKERVFAGLYRKINGKLELKEKNKVCELQEILDKVEKESVFIGDGALVYRDKIREKLKEKAEFLKDSLNISRASIISELAEDKEDNIFLLEPYYIAKSQAEREKEV